MLRSRPGELNSNRIIEDHSLKKMKRTESSEFDFDKTPRQLKKERRIKSFRKAYGMMGMAGPVFGTACTLYLTLTTSGWSWSNEPLSTLLTTPDQPLFTAGLVAAGLMTTIFAQGVQESLPKSRIKTFGTKMLRVSGLSLAAVGLSFLNMNVIHDPAALTYFISTPLAMGAVGASMIRDEGLRKQGILSLIAGFGAMTAIGVSYILKDKAVSSAEFASSAIYGAWIFTFGAAIAMSNRLFGKRKSDKKASAKEEQQDSMP